MRPSFALVVCAALLSATGAQAASAVLLKGRIVSERTIRSLSTVDESPSGMTTVTPDNLRLVRLKVDAVLSGRWQGRTVMARLRHMVHAMRPGTPIYVIFTRGTHGRLQADAWDFADHGVCLTSAQQAEYGIDPARLPKAERCDPE